MGTHRASALAAMRPWSAGEEVRPTHENAFSAPPGGPCRVTAMSFQSRELVGRQRVLRVHDRAFQLAPDLVGVV